MRTFEEFAQHWLDALGPVATTIRRARRSDFPGDPITAANLFVSSLGFNPIIPFESKGVVYGRWHDLAALDRDYADVPRADYAGHLTGMLRRDLVHKSYEWLSADDARACSEEFYSYFANGKVVRLANGLGGGWTPITNSTVEAAYVAMDDDWIGLFVLEDED